MFTLQDVPQTKLAEKSVLLFKQTFNSSLTDVAEQARSLRQAQDV